MHNSIIQGKKFQLSASPSSKLNYIFPIPKSQSCPKLTLNLHYIFFPSFLFHFNPFFVSITDLTLGKYFWIPHSFFKDNKNKTWYFD